MLSFHSPEHLARSRTGPRHIVHLGLVLTLLAACSPPAPETAPAPAAEPLRIQVVHSSDFHGRLLPQVVNGDTVGGSALMAAHLDSLRVRFDGPTIVLSGGDIMQGTAISNLAWGRPAIDVHNRKGLDASALGNHEFDWGLDTLRARVEESEFPWLGANVYLEGTREHPEWARPWVILERSGVRVGVIGVALATTPEVVMAGQTDGLEFGPEAEAIDRSVRELRDEGVDFVVVTGHVGVICESPGEAPEEPSQGCQGRAMEILQALQEPVDLFVGGHTHLRNLIEVDGVSLMQDPAYSIALAVARLQRGSDGPVEVIHRSIIPTDRRSGDPDTAMARVVEEWAEAVRPVMEEPVARLAGPMSNEDRQPRENPAGNLLADAQRWAAGTDVGLVNNGSLRRSLPAGDISFGVLYEFQPFQNELVTIRVDGRLLREILEFGLTDDGAPWVHLSGLQVRYDPDARRGDRIREIRREDGTPVQPDEWVTIGTTEFLATGGDGYEVLTRGEVQGTGITDVDGLADYLRAQGDPVAVPEVGRWTRVEAR